MNQLEIKNLSKEYQVGDSNIVAVKDASIKIKKGEFLSIVGHSGSGKTTLISLIGGILKPSSGQILHDETDICALDDDGLSKYRNEKIGFMFQFASLLPILTSKENILLPIVFNSHETAHAERKAKEYLEMVGMPEKIDAYPSQLSGGQQRRVAIARALINEPEIILADEPTGDLDEKTEADIIKIFHRLNQEMNVTIILVTHNLEIAKQANRQFVMNQGKLTEIKSQAKGTKKTPASAKPKAPKAKVQTKSKTTKTKAQPKTKTTKANPRKK